DEALSNTGQAPDVLNVRLRTARTPRRDERVEVGVNGHRDALKQRRNVLFDDRLKLTQRRIRLEQLVSRGLASILVELNLSLLRAAAVGFTTHDSNHSSLRRLRMPHSVRPDESVRLNRRRVLVL